MSTLTQTDIETERLLLRPFRPRDLSDVFAYCSEPIVSQYLLWNTHRDEKDSQRFLEWTVDTHCNDIGTLFFVYAIELKATEQVIGSIDFKNATPSVGQFDYVLSQLYWGQGIMTEAAAAIRDWAFLEVPGLRAIRTYCQPENIGSSRVMEKIGMTLERREEKCFEIKGEMVDLVYYSMEKP